MRRTLIAASSLALVTAGAFALPSVSQAVSGTGVYGTWTATAGVGGTGEVTFAGTTFPSATFTSTVGTQSVASSATLTSTTPFGQMYGSSSGKTYLSVGVPSTSGTVTLTFASAPAAGIWGFALGDVDAESVAITARDASGNAINVSAWYQQSFNYVTGQTDAPTWNSATGTIVGNVNDTNGASAWFSPKAAVKTITFTSTRLSGIPSYQIWIATDKPSASAAASAASTSASPTASASASASPSASASTSASTSPSASASATASAVAICTSTDTALVNGSFEQPSIPAKSYRQIVDTEVPGWNTTATDKKIEIWSDGYGGVSSPSGSQFAELNATQDSELYQEVATVPGQKLVWSLYHRARGAGSVGDTMYVNIGAPNATPNSTTTINDALTAGWVLHTGTYVVPAGQTSTRFGFESGPTASKNKSIGNFLDHIYFTTESCITPEATKPPVNPPAATPTPTPTVVPKPTETITPDLPEPIPAPIDESVVIVPGDLPGVPDDAEAIDVKDPEHGKAVIEDGQVIYTPDPTYDGPVELVIIVKERDGTVAEVDVPLETGKAQHAVNLTLPDELHKGVNVVLSKPVRTNAKQTAKSVVTCIPVKRMKPIGDIVACRVVTSGGKVIVKSSSAAKVTVTLTAPAKGKYLAYRQVATYRIR
jgi:hypothetical protein